MCCVEWSCGLVNTLGLNFSSYESTEVKTFQHAFWQVTYQLLIRPQSKVINNICDPSRFGLLISLHPQLFLLPLAFSYTVTPLCIFDCTMMFYSPIAIAHKAFSYVLRISSSFDHFLFVFSLYTHSLCILYSKDHCIYVFSIRQ